MGRTQSVKPLENMLLIASSPFVKSSYRCTSVASRYRRLTYSRPLGRPSLSRAMLWGRSINCSSHIKTIDYLSNPLAPLQSLWVGCEHRETAREEVSIRT